MISAEKRQRSSRLLGAAAVLLLVTCVQGLEVPVQMTSWTTKMRSGCLNGILSKLKCRSSSVIKPEGETIPGTLALPMMKRKNYGPIKCFPEPVKGNDKWWECRAARKTDKCDNALFNYSPGKSSGWNHWNKSWKQKLANQALFWRTARIQLCIGEEYAVKKMGRSYMVYSKDVKDKAMILKEGPSKNGAMGSFAVAAVGRQTPFFFTSHSIFKMEAEKLKNKMLAAGIKFIELAAYKGPKRTLQQDIGTRSELNPIAIDLPISFGESDQKHTPLYHFVPSNTGRLGWVGQELSAIDILDESRYPSYKWFLVLESDGKMNCMSRAENDIKELRENAAGVIALVNCEDHPKEGQGKLVDVLPPQQNKFETPTSIHLIDPRQIPGVVEEHRTNLTKMLKGERHGPLEFQMIVEQQESSVRSDVRARFGSARVPACLDPITSGPLPVISPA